tara:strand:- start:412 stop:903 length:492 start_codon:yes stop_codon:yes gene_type:complete
MYNLNKIEILYYKYTKEQNNNMSSASIQNTNPNGDALYKGVSCPMTIGQYMDFPKMAGDLILDNLRKQVPIKDLGDHIIMRMDDWVEKLSTRVRYNEKNGNKSGIKKIVSNWIKACGVSEIEMLVQWNVNVHALLKLKRISNNEDFGVNNVPSRATNSSVARR